MKRRMGFLGTVVLMFCICNASIAQTVLSIAPGRYASSQVKGEHFELHCKSVTQQQAVCDFFATDDQGQKTEPVEFVFQPYNSLAEQSDLFDTLRGVVSRKALPLTPLQGTKDAQLLKAMEANFLQAAKEEDAHGATMDNAKTLGKRNSMCLGVHQQHDDFALCSLKQPGTPALVLFMKGWFTAYPYRLVVMRKLN